MIPDDRSLRCGASAPFPSNRIAPVKGLTFEALYRFDPFPVRAAPDRTPDRLRGDSRLIRHAAKSNARGFPRCFERPVSLSSRAGSGYGSGKREQAEASTACRDVSDTLPRSFVPATG
ncbi:MAG: hypothetical protein AB7W06_06870 [Alphaproteobacteria bacterium]